MSLDRLRLLCRAHHLPDPLCEFRFAPPRRWRFDWAWPPAQVAIEQEGGAWTHGRHVRGGGYLADLEKYNRAALDGWCVLRFTPEQIRQGACLPLLRSALTRRWEAWDHHGMVVTRQDERG